jgi:formate dehydrogenase major subunit
MSRQFREQENPMHLRQPFSPRTAALHSRLRGTTVTHGVCPYCAVGCSQLVYTTAGRIVNIEGDPRSPISHGGLCPKGANTLQLVANPHRLTKVKYRAPYATAWEEKPLDWALDRVAQLVKETRDRDFVEQDPETGMTVNHVKTIASLGGSACDNEENCLIKKLLTGGLGILPVENQARL